MPAHSPAHPVTHAPGTESSSAELAEAVPALTRKPAPRYGRRAALVIAVAGLFSGLLARIALQGYPFSGDEYSTVLQAEGFARGVLKAPAPPWADCPATAGGATVRVDEVRPADAERTDRRLAAADIAIGLLGLRRL